MDFIFQCLAQAFVRRGMYYIFQRAYFYHILNIDTTNKWFAVPSLM